MEMYSRLYFTFVDALGMFEFDSTSSAPRTGGTWKRREVCTSPSPSRRRDGPGRNAERQRRYPGLAAQLPLTLELDDVHETEKVAGLPAKLSQKAPRPAPR
jgi:hypothetical protein